MDMAMAARLGPLVLPHAALLGSSAAASTRALTPSRARLPYPPPPFPTCCRPSSAAAAHAARPLPRRGSPRLLAVRAMASGNPYAAELAAAKKAVTLAARLCQVPFPVLRGSHFSLASCGAALAAGPFFSSRVSGSGVGRMKSVAAS